MKKRFGFLLILLIILNSCNSKTTDKTNSAKNDSIQKYLALANNDTLAFDKRIKYNDKALAFVDLKKNDSLTREYLNKIVYNYLVSQSLKKYKKYSVFYFENASKANDTLNLARYNRYMGGYFRGAKVFDSAFYYYLKSEKLYQKTKDKLGLARVYLSKSVIQNQLSDYLGAELSARKAYSFFKGSEFHYDFYMSAVILGNVYQDLKEYDKAIIKLEESLILIKKYEFRNTQNDNLIGTCLNNLGNAYKEQKNYQKAISYFNLALTEKKSLKNNPALYGYLFNNLGYCYLKTNYKKDFSALFYKADKIFDSLQVKNEQSITNLNLSEFYFKKKDSILARIYIEKALVLAKESNAPYYYLTALSNAGSINPKKAPKYIKEYHQLNDSLLFAERTARNQYYKIQLETEEINQQKETAVKQKSVVIAIALTLLFITILIVIIARQQIKQKELRLHQTRQNANEEIYQLMLSQENKTDEARQKEKKRIGLELHDGIMNKLVSTRLNLSILSINRNEKTIEKCLDYIKDIQNIENEIRNVAHDLNQEAFNDANGFSKMLNHFIDDQNKISKTNFTVNIDQTIDWNVVSTVKKMNLYRIIQEASHNINKHAQAKNATINIMTDDENIYMSIVDNGIGFKSSIFEKGIGLKNMKYRVKELNGNFEISSKRNSPTSINITIPIKDV